MSFAPCGAGDNRTRFAFLSMAKIMVLPPSSRRQATVHRTVAFRWVRVLCRGNKQNPNLSVRVSLISETIGSAGGSAPQKALALSIERSVLLTNNIAS